jgi:hypothetical protein
VVSSTFVADLLDQAAPIAQFDHPDRDCAYDEAQFSAQLPRYADCPLLEQELAYRDVWGFPAHWGLWASGVIARHHDPRIMPFGTLWLDECTRRTFQDQVSEPFALWVTGLRPVSLPGSHLANGWLHHHPSGRHG